MKKIINKEDLNFTVILPGGCNANCSFCINSYPSKAKKDYLQNLKNSIEDLPDIFKNCTISGGEPTISPQFEKVLEILTNSNKFDKIVLNTNGTNLENCLEIISKHIDCLNISRHGCSYEKNVDIFKTKKIPDDTDINQSIEFLHKKGIPTTLNMVYNNSDFKITKKFIIDYIQYAKKLNADYITFRYDHSLNFAEKTYAEEFFDDYENIVESSCPVCYGVRKFINGMNVHFKSSFLEPSMETDEIFEIICHPDGKNYADWNAKIPIQFNTSDINMNTNEKILEALNKQNKLLTQLLENRSEKDESFNQERLEQYYKNDDVDNYYKELRKKYGEGHLLPLKDSFEERKLKDCVKRQYPILNSYINHYNDIIKDNYHEKNIIEKSKRRTQPSMGIGCSNGRGGCGCGCSNGRGGC
jgi:MoaA/NifB/PqqE/SkfB family radical SAM enzyme